MDVPANAGSDRRRMRPTPVIVYLALLVAVAAWAMVAISRRATQPPELKAATLLYLGQDPTQADMAAKAHRLYGVTTVELTDPGAGRIVRNLLGSDRAIAPTLVSRVPGGLQASIGFFAVSAQLQAPIDSADPARKGSVAIAILVSLFVLAFAYARELAFLAAYAPFVGAAGLGYVEGRCASCSIGVPILATFAPIIGVAYLAAALAAFTWPVSLKRWFYWSFLAVSAAIPIGELGLIAYEPKLCFGCITFGACAAICTVSAWQTLRSGALTGLGVPWAVRAIAGVAVFGLATYHGLVLAGTVKPSHESEIHMPHLVGQRIADFVQGGMPPPRSLVLVTLPGCSACEGARNYLAKNGRHWTEYSICAAIHGPRCFNAKGLQFPLPMFLVVDAKGVVNYQFNGWPGESPDSATILANVDRSIIGDHQ